jgi:type II secretion system (T2SS) protein E
VATHGSHLQRKKLGDILMADGLIDELQLRAAIGHQKKWGGKFGSALVDLGILREQDLAKVLERQMKERCLTESMMRPEPNALKLLTVADATRHVVLPLRLEGNDLVLAMSNPSDLALIDELGFKLKKRVRGVLAVETAIKSCIKKYYAGGSETPEQAVEIDVSPEAAPMEIIHHEKDTRSEVKKPARAAEPARVEPSAAEISKALAYLLIEKGIIGREELIEKMKALREKDQH